MEQRLEKYASAKTQSEMIITPEDISRPDVTALLETHFTAMVTIIKTTTRILDLSTLQHPSITIFTARETTSNELMGCVALKHISPSRGELKCMRTAENHQRKGVAGALLRYLLNVAKMRVYEEVILETGPQVEFDTARALYLRYGFVICDGFEGYESDGFEERSVFMIYDIK